MHKRDGCCRKINPRHLERPHFYTKDGWLTSYALACGYVEEKDYGPVRLTLFRDGGCYHVRAYDHDQKIRLFREGFRTLTEARRHYKYVDDLLTVGVERKLDFAGSDDRGTIKSNQGIAESN